MNWIKTKNKLPIFEKDYNELVPVAILYVDDVKKEFVFSYGYIYKEYWLDWNTQNKIDPPDFWMNLTFNLAGLS